MIGSQQAWLLYFVMSRRCCRTGNFTLQTPEHKQTTPAYGTIIIPRTARRRPQALLTPIGTDSREPVVFSP